MKLSPDAKTLISLAMNIRRHLNPPLPDGYYGNAFINANAVLTGKDLNEKPLSETAKVIKECKKSSSTNEYIYTTLELVARMRELNVMLEGIALELTDCRQIGLNKDIDFGWGGGVRVHVTLPRAAMPKFKEEMDALKVQEDHNDNALCA
ncbi:hypothetical protein Q3G72_021844 [Acer saccharum]|nr:hypothetical protein Q3G72_021844 [Acer saccharum]